MGAQSQVAYPSPEMVCPKLFVPVFPYPSRKELVLEAWTPCCVARMSSWAGEPMGVARAATFSSALGATGEVHVSQPAPKS